MHKNKKIIISLIIIFIILIIIGFIFLYLHKKDKIVPTEAELKPTEYKAQKLENASEILKYSTCTSTNEDESCYLIINKAMLTLKNAKVTKEEGDTSSIEDSLNNGLNSAILATYDTILKADYTDINTSANGSAGIYINGQKAEGDLNNTTISTINSNSPGLVASNTGTITGGHNTITTKVKKSPAIQVVKSKGNITLDNSLLETNGSSSPIIDSYGNVSLTDSTGTANASRIANIYSDGNIVLNNSSFIVAGGEPDEYASSAILITGTKENKSVFQSINSSLNINQNLAYYNIATFFVIANTNTEIDLESSTINYGSNKLLQATNSNITMNLNKQTIYGEIELNNSTLDMNLQNTSSYTGNLKDNIVSVYLSKDSELNLTGDTYLKSLKNDDSSNNNIVTNGYHLYVNNVEIK